MKIIARYKFHSAAALAVLLTAAVVAFAGKPTPPPPPPPPPAATYEIEFLWTGSVTDMNQAGDMIGLADGVPCLYIADLDTVIDPNWLLSAEDAQRWFIHWIDGGINNVGEFVCWATYLPNDGVLVRNGRYPCRLNRITGTIEPFITAVPPGLPNPFYCSVRGLADDGTVGGYFTDGSRHYAFIVSPDNELSYPWGGPLDAPVYDSYVSDMNASGQIVGTVYPMDAPGEYFGYRYSPDSPTVTFDDQGWSRAQSINNHGDVVGDRAVTVTTTKPRRTVTTTKMYRYSDDPDAYSDDDASGTKLFDSAITFPSGINDGGDIVASNYTTTTVYLEAYKAWLNLSTTPGAVQGTPQDVQDWYRLTNPEGSPDRRNTYGINNAGWICGTLNMDIRGVRVFVLRPTSP